MAVYLVTQADAPEGTLPRMVEARTGPAAVAHVARNTFGTQVLTTKEAVEWSKQGVEIEDPKADAEQE